MTIIIRRMLSAIVAGALLLHAGFHVTSEGVPAWAWTLLEALVVGVGACLAVVWLMVGSVSYHLRHDKAAAPDWTRTRWRWLGFGPLVWLWLFFVAPFLRRVDTDEDKPRVF